MTELPAEWRIGTIGEVARVNPPGSTVSAPDEQPVTFLPMAAVEELTGRIDTSDTRPFGVVKKGFTRFRDGDVLVAKITPSMENGKVAVARQLTNGMGCGSTEFHVIRPHEGMSADYLRYFLVRSAFRHEARLNMQGAVGQQRVPAEFLRNATLPIAPHEQQPHIVSRIDELFSRIEEGERALERVQTLVERYRQSVLKAAVTGELTREWRERHSAKAWRQVRVDEAGEVQLGRQRSPAHHQGEHMRPYLRVANVYEERIDIGDVMSMNFSPQEFERFQLRFGDILLNEGQSKELVGRPALYRDELPGACFTNTLVRFRCGPDVLPEFAMCVFLHFMKSGAFQRIAKITTNIAHLGAGRFAEMAFPLPCIDEQVEIADRVKRLNDVHAHAIVELARQQQRVVAVRQSVLKAAFAGELVSAAP